MDHILVINSAKDGCAETKRPPETLITKFVRFLNSNSACNYLWTVAVFMVLIAIILLCKTYVKALLMWLSYQDPILVNFLFILLYTLVSFPILWGYMLLTLASGYLFGFFHGLFTVILSANVGVAIAHYCIRCFHKKYPIVRIEKSDYAQAVLRVIGGPQSMKVVFFCRLSPIPFGLQSTIFALSNVSSRTFHLATFLGLLPAQCLATYLGSTLRSMEDVINGDSHATTGIVVLCIQVTCGIGLLLYIIHKAKIELKRALLLQQIDPEASDLTSVSIN